MSTFIVLQRPVGPLIETLPVASLIVEANTEKAAVEQAVRMGMGGGLFYVCSLDENAHAWEVKISQTVKAVKPTPPIVEPEEIVAEET